MSVGPAKKSKEFQVVFYNVENLFDTINNPNTHDDEFTPEGKKAWNAERYNKKLENLSKVLSSMNTERLPDVIGLCEVENKTVVEHLVATNHLKTANYQIVHQDSPDQRGIDVALLYNAKTFKVISKEFIHVTLPNPERPQTRDVLYVKGVVKKDTLHLFVNHWPSRYGGEEKSRPNRIHVAKIVRSKYDSLCKAVAQPKVLLMGDFNDHPDNASIQDILKAGTFAQTNKGTLYNMMAAMHANKEGSYNYKGNWGALDQIMVSHALLAANAGKKRLRVAEGAARVFKQDWMLYKDPKYGDTKPSRTYGGPNYYGGYSDHLPVYVTLQLK